MKRAVVEIEPTELGFAVIGLSKVVRAMGQEIMHMESSRKDAIERLRAIPKARPVLDSPVGWALEKPNWDFAQQLCNAAYALKILGSDLLELVDEHPELKPDEEKL